MFRRRRCRDGFNVVFVQAADNLQHGGQAGSVIGDAGSAVDVAVSVNFAVSTGREHGVDVSADDECGTVAGAFSAADNIADGVLFDIGQTVLFEHTEENLGSFFFMEGRSRSFGQNDLVGNALFLLFDGSSRAASTWTLERRVLMMS